MALPSIDRGGVVSRGHGHSQGPSDGVRQDLDAVSTVQNGPIGALRVLPDGSKWRYCYFAEACAAGKMAGLDVTSQVVATTAATALRNSAGNAADYAAAATGPIYLLDTDKFTSAHSDGVFDGGLLVHVDGGARLPIAKSDYTGSTSVLKLDLVEGWELPIAFDSEDTVQVMSSDYYGLTIAKQASDCYCIGVPIVAVAAGEYAWVQRSGTALGFADGTIAAGMLLTLSDGVNGAVQEIGGDVVFASETVTTSDLELAAITTEPYIGQAVTAGANAKFFLIKIAFE